MSETAATFQTAMQSINSRTENEPTAPTPIPAPAPIPGRPQFYSEVQEASEAVPFGDDAIRHIQDMVFV